MQLGLLLLVLGFVVMGFSLSGKTARVLKSIKGEEPEK